MIFREIWYKIYWFFPAKKELSPPDNAVRELMDQKRKNVISLKRIHIYLILVVVIISGMVLYSTIKLTSSFLSLTEASRQHYELFKAAHELMDASDYLTESVQRFTASGDRKFLDHYFTEAFETARREEALSKMSVVNGADAALEDLQAAMDNSVNLMDQEYYAMRLVVEAKDYSDYPEVLDKVQLSPEDSNLSAQDKMRRATELVLNDEYYAKKESIRREMQESIDDVEKMMQLAKDKELSALKRQVIFVLVFLLIQIILTFMMLRLTTRLGIRPILDAVDRIKADEPIPETGAVEYIYLAKAYNKMYSKYQNRLEKLNFKASHDELTGAYNRAGYDIVLSSIDLSSTYMILFDVDNFKTINDTFGHETGDRILIKLVQVLKGVFRDDDYICRLGGDEFVVFMVHSSGMQRGLIESKIEQINSELENIDDGLPPISISAGIANGKDIEDTSTLFERTDAAMYESKKKGKNTYTFSEI